MKLKLITLAALFVSIAASAQTNLQTFYDLGKGRQYITTTFEMFKGDKWGDTFFFIDHYYATSDQRSDHLASAVNGSYFEIERGINFWQDSDLKDLSGHIEYDGSSWGAGILCLGAKYCFHNDDFSKMFTAYLMYDQHLGVGKADIPVKLSGVWGISNILGVEGLNFKGFFDLWGNNSTFPNPDDLLNPYNTKLSFLTEPQIWYNMACIGVENLNLGGEIELSYNFADNKGFMCNPCLGLKWEF